MNFGSDSADSSYKQCKNKKPAKFEEETFKTEPLYSWKAETHRNQRPVARINETFVDKYSVAQIV